MGRLIDLSGRRFGKLTVLRRTTNRGNKTMWECECDCGSVTVVSGSNLVQGNVKSCGCLWKETVPSVNKEKRTRHSESNTKLHKTWCNMRYRCNNPNCKFYSNYGGRGIKICKEWEIYENFRDWSLANGFEEGLSIDRIDNDGNYEPTNCRWVETKTQINNRRVSHNLTYQGVTHTIAEWSDITGIKWTTIKERLKHGWSIEKVLTTKPTK